MSTLEVLELKYFYNDSVNCIFPVILRDDKEMILIDCGYPNSLELIEKAAKENNVDISNLTKVIITHHDYDHMGSLAELKRKYPSVEIISSIEEEKYVSGKVKSLRLQQAEDIYDILPENEKAGAREFQKQLEALENVFVDKCVEDGEVLNYCGGLEIINTPGHMPGHISIYVKESKTLITGDALVIEKGHLSIANPEYTLDMVSAKESIKKFMPYNIEKIICYHGGVLTNNIKEELEKVL